MKKHETKKRLKILWRTLAVILVLVAAVPYLVPLSANRAVAGPQPFDNSAFEEVNGFSFHYRAYRPDDGLILIRNVNASLHRFFCPCAMSCSGRR